VKDFCISLFKKEQEEKAYKNYVAECLRLVTENTAKTGGGSYVRVKYYDIVNPKQVDNRSANEIIDGIKDKIEKMND
jgi:hypothetical protein